ncbi:MAG: Hint domain-containing protein [Roseovarius sp.]|uniref:Hint domain-containing protein n=1 Tax=Roseovarius sp. TaxID=1486281 RepID=UPI0032EC00D9
MATNRVEGDNSDNRIDATFAADPEGEAIDAGNGPGGTNNDVVDGFGGSDTILSGDGDDSVFAGSGSDSVEGGAGNDLLVGDSSDPGAGREVFQWDLAPDPNDADPIEMGDPINGFVQDTGSVDVTFSVLQATGPVSTTFADNPQNVDRVETGGTPADASSSMAASLPSAGTTDLKLEFSAPVNDVSFQINDLDGTENVQIFAFDGDDNLIPVALTGGTDVSVLSGEEATGSGSGTDADAANALSVSIAGPVAQVVVRYTDADGSGDGINLTDVYFNPIGGVVDGGAPGDDTLIGEDGDDTLLGEDGNDVLDGGPGNDSIEGGPGDDTITGGAGNDTVFGGDGNDLIDTSAPVSGTPPPLPDLGFPGLFPADSDPEDDRDFVSGGDGNDTIFTGDDRDTIFGDAGNDFIDGGIDADEIDGGDGNDTIIGGEGSDTITGGAGDDLIFGGLDPSLPDELNIPDDTDLVTDNGRDFIDGGDGNDTIFGQDDDDTILGGAGDDMIDGGIDDDSIGGGSGNDTLIGGTGDDTVLGGAGNDLISGGEGADSLMGGDDRDVFLDVGAGDTIDGGTGDSTDDGIDDDFDTLDLRGLGRFEIVGETVDPDGDSTSGTVNFLAADDSVSGTLEFSEIENLIPCFTPGTLIATPRGEKLVEELQLGDRVITRDNGLQEIRWIGHRALGMQDLQNAPHLKPVQIRAGALGHGLPERDMLVSPQHRLLLNSERAALYFEEREVLAAAKHLTGMEGVDQVDASGTTYIHFMFDQHEVVLSNGAWTESFQPGEQVLDGMGIEQRDEIFDLFPELREAHGIEAYQAARRSLKKHEARLLVE